MTKYQVLVGDGKFIFKDADNPDREVTKEEVHAIMMMAVQRGAFYAVRNTEFSQQGETWGIALKSEYFAYASKNA